ncbi:MAG TPA: hypothetical protein VGX71_24770 [Pseudaminobacter sp.]|nr:hypothetical protein [Pseudaminobacter sp.]
MSAGPGWQTCDDLIQPDRPGRQVIHAARLQRVGRQEEVLALDLHAVAGVEDQDGAVAIEFPFEAAEHFLELVGGQVDTGGDLEIQPPQALRYPHGVVGRIGKIVIALMFVVRVADDDGKSSEIASLILVFGDGGGRSHAQKVKRQKRQQHQEFVGTYHLGTVRCMWIFGNLRTP